MSQQQPALARPAPMVRQGTRWGIATGHSGATAAALRVIGEGGSVVDAAIAASAVLTVAMPHATSLGGDAFMLMREARSGRILGLNASGCAPAGADPALFRDGMPIHGPMAALVPGLVGGWDALHRRAGLLRWEALFDEARELAGAGCAVTRGLAAGLAQGREILLRDQGCADLFFPSGTALAPGELLSQPALAHTFEEIAARGSDAFYRGPLASRLADGIRGAGGLLAAADLDGFRADWVEPVTLRHGEFEIHVTPPNSLGVLMLMQLQALRHAREPQALRADAALLYRQTNVMRAVFEVALPHMGDPRHVQVPGGRLLYPPYSDEVERLLRHEAHTALEVPGAGTACVTVGDNAGNAACIVQSIFNPFGAHFLEPGTGILLNNRLSGFTHVQGRPNTVAPGRRCTHTLNPAMVTRNGRLHLVYASPGGASQTTTGTQVLTNVLDCRMDLADAISAPRWAIDRQQNVLLEPAWPAACVEELRSLGVEFRQEANDYFFGSATAVQAASGGGLLAVADARREAAAFAA